MPTAAELNKLKVDELQKLLKDKGLPVAGKKVELVQVSALTAEGRGGHAGQRSWDDLLPLAARTGLLCRPLAGAVGTAQSMAWIPRRPAACGHRMHITCSIAPLPRLRKLSSRGFRVCTPPTAADW